MIIGVYGNLGAGKTTITKIIAKLNFNVINADKIAAEVINNQYIKKVIKQNFPESFDGDILNRSKLRRIISNDIEKMNLLNSILWPEIKNQILFLIEKYKEGNVVIDAALLPKLELPIEKYIMIRCSLLTSLIRIKKRDNKSFIETFKIFRKQKKAFTKYKLPNKILIDNNWWNKKQTMKTIYKKINK